MNTTKRAIAAVILTGAALSAPTQAYAADALAAPVPVAGPLVGGILDPLLGGLADPATMLNTLLPNGVLGG
ncbi:hypothetical protein O1Q96_23100 [Streptomyces sp. Qhu-G9]|uniref:hypothetical protein n=1 Tax=Streptomyces sp. Qhu-G9 TaxID=3452799 RepID=UPI0022AC1273|nr:hypothetical protein [Streptomyces aurantiacus]WAU82390.1 hypothetical protein O1Q96_23100 [Streptomyces aurantiacus]